MENFKQPSLSQPSQQIRNSTLPLWIFVISTVVLTIVVILLPLPELAGPVIVVFIPLLIAAVLIRLTEGKGRVRQRLFSGQIWQFNLKWILISLGLGVGLRLLVSLIGMLFVPEYKFQPGQFTPLLLVTLVFATGEEIGWRGYALPELIRSGASPVKASIYLGIPWAFLHLPLTLPGKLAEGTPPLAQFLVILSMSVLTAWLYLNPKKNLLAPVIFHGSQNAASGLNAGLPLILNNWLMALVYGAAALLVILLTRGRLGNST